MNKKRFTVSPNSELKGFKEEKNGFKRAKLKQTKNMILIKLPKTEVFENIFILIL